MAIVLGILNQIGLLPFSVSAAGAAISFGLAAVGLTNFVPVGCIFGIIAAARWHTDSTKSEQDEAESSGRSNKK